jgi:hypothetical protein
VQRHVFGAALLAFFSVACSSVKEPLGRIDYDLYPVCRIEEFAGAKRAVEYPLQISEPFILRQVKGKIIHANWQGAWQDRVWPILELRGPGKSEKNYEVRGDSTGHFMLKNLPEGRYCFFASANLVGWTGAYGIIIIDKKANPNKEIEIVLGFGAP